MSRKPALLKPKPSRGSKETRAFDRVEPRIADIDRVFHRGLQPVRGGFQTTPRGFTRRFWSQASVARRVSADCAFAGEPGNLTREVWGFSGVWFAFVFQPRDRTGKQSRDVPENATRARDWKHFQTPRRRESKTSAVLDGAVRFLLTVSAFLYPSSRTRQRARRALPRARRTPHAGTLAHASTNTPAGRFVDPDRVRRQRARSDATEARHLHLRIEPNVSRARVKHHH